jgi:uncharacterized cupin superfamily protein
VLIVRAGTESLDNVEVKLDAAATGGAFAILELALAPGRDSGFHRHTKEDEAIVVLDGELTVGDDERRETLRARDTVLFARGDRHRFANEGARPVRALVVTAPAGLERFFREVAAGTDPSRAASEAGLEFEKGDALEA